MKKVRRMKKIPNRIGVIITSIEVLILAFILIESIKYSLTGFDKCTESISGRIVRTEKSVLGETKYVPIYEIEVNGKKYEHKRTYTSVDKDWSDGDAIQIKFNPLNPKQMYSINEIRNHKMLSYSRIIGTILLIGLFIFAKLIAR